MAMAAAGRQGARNAQEAGMAAEKVDRRVRRTRELLRGALIALILEKGYERVTVQDVIDRADVGRSTFYAHFRDKEDLLFYGLEEFRAAFQPARHDPDGSQPGKPAPSPTLVVFDHFGRYREVWKAMAGKRGAEVFSRYLHKLLSDLLRTQLSALAPEGEPQVPVDAVVEFAASTLIGLGARWWLEQDLPYSPQEMDAMYHRLVDPAIHAGLRPKGEGVPAPGGAGSANPA